MKKISTQLEELIKRKPQIKECMTEIVHQNVHLVAEGLVAHKNEVAEAMYRELGLQLGHTEPQENEDG